MLGTIFKNNMSCCMTTAHKDMGRNKQNNIHCRADKYLMQAMKDQVSLNDSEFQKGYML